MGNDGFTRRGFLKGAAWGVAGASAAALGLPGCAPKAKEPSAAAAGSQQADDLLWTARINPQDEDYRGTDSDLATLFSPWSLGSIGLSHRMVKSAAGSACYLAGLTDELFQYYLNFARGGVELIWVEGEAFSIPEDGSEVPRETSAFFRRLADECASFGASLGLQWAPFGRPVDSLTVDQIHSIEDKGAATAVALKDMGFKAIEINAAGFNQGELFNSRFHNTRTDEYGAQNIENRARFVCETIRKIKDACGGDFAVQVLLDAIEENDNLDNNATLMTLDSQVTDPFSKAMTIEESIALAKLFEKAGADSLHLRLGPLNNHPCQFASDLYFILAGIEGATGFGTVFDFSKHFQGLLDGSHSGAGMLLDVAARFKKEVSIPCGVVTYMDPAHAPEFFERALADGKCDFYVLNRPLTVDSDYVGKLREGRRDEIAPCTRCLHCHAGSNEMNAAMSYCRVNALTQRVMRQGGPSSYELPALKEKKRVAVVGGGPAGMEAARIAAARGHEVTLYEKSGALGGAVSFASTVKGPHENLDDLVAYLARQCELAGVETVLGTEVTAQVLAEAAFDAVVFATGAKRPALEVDGAAVVELADFMAKDLGEDVVVYGSSAQAFDAALWLTVRKKRVTIVTPDGVDALDMQQSMHAKRFMTSALYALGVKVYTESDIVSGSEGSLRVSSRAMGVEVDVPCDTVVNAGTWQADTALADSFAGEKFAVGDCAAPFNIALAIRSGNDAGRAI